MKADAASNGLRNNHWVHAFSLLGHKNADAYRRAARTSAGGLGVPGGARVGLRRSGERGKQITQVRLVRGTAQHGTDLEDLFDRPQRRAVVIVD